VSETEVLDRVLGARDSRLTGNRMTDLLTGLDELDQLHDEFLLHRRVLLHGVHSEVKQSGTVSDIWAEVARIRGVPRSTVHRWAHPPGIRKEEGAPDQEVYD
jgi:hypothetical protein